MHASAHARPVFQWVPHGAWPYLAFTELCVCTKQSGWMEYPFRKYVISHITQHISYSERDIKARGCRRRFADNQNSISFQCRHICIEGLMLSNVMRVSVQSVSWSSRMKSNAHHDPACLHHPGSPCRHPLLLPSQHLPRRTLNHLISETWGTGIHAWKRTYTYTHSDIWAPDCCHDAEFTVALLKSACTR